MCRTPGSPRRRSRPRGRRAGTCGGLTKVDAELAKGPPAGMVYAGTIYNGGSAAFRGTGPDDGKPRTIFVLKRGDVKSPLQEVTAGTVTMLRDLPGSFNLSPQV